MKKEKELNLEALLDRQFVVDFPSLADRTDQMTKEAKFIYLQGAIAAFDIVEKNVLSAKADKC